MEDTRIEELQKRIQVLEASMGTVRKIKREKRAPSAYNLFMREEFSKIKSSLPEGGKINNQDVLRDIAKKWKVKNTPETKKEAEEDKPVKAVKAVNSVKPAKVVKKTADI